MNKSSCGTALFIIGFFFIGFCRGACTINKHIQTRQKFSVLPLEYTGVLDFSDSRCGGEWKTHGMCCNRYTVLPHVELDKRSIMNAASKTIETLPNFKDVISTLFLKLKQLALASENSIFPGFTIQINFAKAFLENGTNLYNFEQFADIGQDTMVSKFKNLSDVCWSRLIQQRTSSICSVCSGRSQVYFNLTKGLAVKGACIQALASCTDYFGEAIRFVKMLYWLAQIGPVLHSHSIYVPVFDRMDMAAIQEYYKELVSDSLAFKLSTYGKMLTQNSTLAVQICDKFFNLAARPFIENFSSKFSFLTKIEVTLWWEANAPIQKSLESITSKMPAYNAKLASLLSAWKTSNQGEARWLQLNQFTSTLSILSSDVQFTDTVTTSASVCYPSQLNGKCAMNLTIVFP